MPQKTLPMRAQSLRLFSINGSRLSRSRTLFTCPISDRKIPPATAHETSEPKTSKAEDTLSLSAHTAHILFNHCQQALASHALHLSEDALHQLTTLAGDTPASADGDAQIPASLLEPSPATPYQKSTPSTTPHTRRALYATQESDPYSRRGMADEPEPYNATRGEQALWQAVITQALMDAANQSTKEEAKHAKREALAWLRGTSADFYAVCDYAGLNPDHVRSRAKQALERNCQWRAQAGQGPRYGRVRKKPAHSVLPLTGPKPA